MLHVQPSVGFYTGQNSMAAPQLPPRQGGGDQVSGAGVGGRPGGTWPPADVSLNLNKAITKRLANATHYQQLLDIISDSAMYFDEVQAAAPHPRDADSCMLNDLQHHTAV